MIGLFDDLTVCTPLPQYLPFPKFLLDIKLSHTAKLLYALLLDRATLSRKNNWTDEQDRIYVIYPIPKLAQALGCSFSSVTRSLTELTDAGLIERTRSGFSKPSRIFLKIPHTAQNCSVTLRISDSPDYAKMTNMIVQKCTPNYLNKNNLNFNYSIEQSNIPLYDGLLYCGKCHAPKEMFFAKGIVLMGRNRHPIECACCKAKREQQEVAIRQQKHRDLVRRLKAEGFSDTAMLNWTFENDNGHSPQMHHAHRYV